MLKLLQKSEGLHDERGYMIYHGREVISLIIIDFEMHAFGLSPRLVRANVFLVS